MTNSELGFDYLRDNLAQVCSPLEECATKLAVGGCCRLRAGILHVGSAAALKRPQSAPCHPACPPVTRSMPPTGVLANPTRRCPALPQDKEELVLRPFNFCIIDEVGTAGFALHAK